MLNLRDHQPSLHPPHSHSHNWRPLCVRYVRLVETFNFSPQHHLPFQIYPIFQFGLCLATMMLSSTNGLYSRRGDRLNTWRGLCGAKVFLFCYTLVLSMLNLILSIRFKGRPKIFPKSALFNVYIDRFQTLVGASIWLTGQILDNPVGNQVSRETHDRPPYPPQSYPAQRWRMETSRHHSRFTSYTAGSSHPCWSLPTRYKHLRGAEWRAVALASFGRSRHSFRRFRSYRRLWVWDAYF